MDKNRVFVFASLLVPYKNANTESILADVFEKEGKIYVELEIPELQMESLSFDISYKSLQIMGIKGHKMQNGVTYIRAERFFGYFKKVIDLPIKVEKILNIKYTNGVLELILERF